MDFKSNPQWLKAGLEYIGESTTAKLVTVTEKWNNRETKVPYSPPEFREYVAQGNFGVAYVLNPFDIDRDGSFAVDLLRSDFARLVISQGAEKCEVAHGKGVIRDFRTGIAVYTGEFENGFRSGKGVAPIYIGSRAFEGEYTGQWKFSMRHGVGQMKYSDGSVFRGNWAYDQKSGLGVEVDNLGGKYIGIWRDSVKHGSGQYFWAEGDKTEYREYENGRLLRYRDSDQGSAKLLKSEQEFNTFIDGFKVEVSVPKSSQGQIAQVDKPDPAPFTGMAPRKSLKHVQESILPESAAALTKILGKTVTLEVDEKPIRESPTATVVLYTMEVDDGALSSGSIVSAIKGICEDEFVKEVVVDKLTKILITHVQDEKHTTGATFKDGTLQISHNFNKALQSGVVASVVGKAL